MDKGTENEKLTCENITFKAYLLSKIFFFYQKLVQASKAILVLIYIPCHYPVVQLLLRPLMGA